MSVYVNIKVAPGRRVRHPVHRTYMETERVYRVKRTPQVARKLSSGDVVLEPEPDREGGDA